MALNVEMEDTVCLADALQGKEILIFGIAHSDLGVDRYSISST